MLDLEGFTAPLRDAGKQTLPAMITVAQRPREPTGCSAHHTPTRALLIVDRDTLADVVLIVRRSQPTEVWIGEHPVRPEPAR